MYMALYIGGLLIAGLIAAFILAKPDKMAQKLTEAEEALYEAKPATAEELTYDAKQYILDGCKNR